MVNSSYAFISEFNNTTAITYEASENIASVNYGVASINVKKGKIYLIIAATSGHPTIIENAEIINSKNTLNNYAGINVDIIKATSSQIIVKHSGAALGYCIPI